MRWILIITLLGYSSTAMISVDFETKKACEIAALAHRASLPNKQSNLADLRYTGYVCVAKHEGSIQ